MQRFSPNTSMLAMLAHVADAGCRLVDVSVARYKDSPNSTTAVALQFEGLPVVFRANPDDDTLIASVGLLTPEMDEVVVQASELPPWRACMECGVKWAWQMTNQQGYCDGVRMEFGTPCDPPAAIVEILAVASDLKFFAVAETLKNA